MRTFILIGAFVAPLALRAQAPTAASPYVETSGYGERRIAPDRATVMMNVTAKGAAAAAAAAENARIQARVIDTLRALGFGNAAAMASYNVGPNYEPDPAGNRAPRLSGYAARAAIRVRVTDIDAIGRIIDAALARGATGVDGVFYESTGAEAARRSALSEAATMAHADAEALARALGGALGSVISATTTADPRRNDMTWLRGAAMSSTGGAPTQIVPSEILVVAGTQVRWQFVPGR